MTISEIYEVEGAFQHVACRFLPDLRQTESFWKAAALGAETGGGSSTSEARSGSEELMNIWK